MSKGVLVVEAAIKSGSLITARAAIAENREVFAVPGSIFSETSEGTHMLIRDGAHMATSAGDVLSVLGFDVAGSWGRAGGHEGRPYAKKSRRNGNDNLERPHDQRATHRRRRTRNGTSGRGRLEHAHHARNRRPRATPWRNALRAVGHSL